MEEKRIRNFKVKEACKLITKRVAIDILGAAIICLFAYFMYLIWWNFTESDVLYLCGWYFIIGSFFNLTVCCVLEWIHSLYWDRSIRLIRIRAKVRARMIKKNM